MHMSNTKFNAVTKGFQTSFRRVGGNPRRRKFYKRLANRAARRSWFNGVPRATEYCW